MSISAVIVDDEQLARDELAYLLKEFDVDVVAQGKNGVEAVNLIKELSPDIVFLDVQMPGLDGFGVMKKLLDRKVAMPQIVFATAFDQYAVKAFEVNAVDYLLKPFDKKRVAQAVEKAKKKLGSSGSSSDQIGTLVKMLEQQQQSASGEGPAEVGGALVPGGPEGHLLRLDRGRDHYRGCDQHGRAVELPNAGRVAGLAGSQHVLAGASFVPGEHPAHQGSRPMVQELLPDPHGRQETGGDSGEPRANQAAARAVQFVAIVRESIR